MKLQQYPWPGNVRELENVVENGAILSHGEVITEEDLELAPVARSGIEQTIPEPAPGFLIEEYLSDQRNKIIDKALNLSGGNRSKAARLLGITPQAVHKFVKGKKV